MILAGPQQTGGMIPAVNLGAAPSSPRDGLGRSGVEYREGMMDGEEEDELAKRKRLSSGKFKQDGGILGRLGFEGSDGVPVHPGSVDEEEGPSSDLAEPAEIAAERYEALDPAPEEPDAPGGSGIEFLESAEKKNKFWIGRRRTRKASKSASDFEDDARVSLADNVEGTS